MLTKGEYIVCGSKGVCMVEDITTVRMEGVDSHKLFYLLRPVSSKSSTVYMAVDNKLPSFRKLLSREEALALVESVPTIGFLCITDDKSGEAVYKESFLKNDIVELVKIIKTSYLRRKERLNLGRKVVAVDDKYYHMACDYLFNELSVCLDIDKAEIEKSIMDRLYDEEPKDE